MDPQCELAEELFYSGKLHVLQWIHLTFCVLSVILCIFTAWKYVHKSLFESSTKELIIALYVLCIFHAGAFAIIQALHLISRYTASVPCDAQIPKRLCIIRNVVSSSLPGFCILHFGIVIQRFQSTFQYNAQLQQVTARLFILISIVYPCVFGFVAFRTVSQEGRSTLCISFNKSTELIMMLNLYGMIGLDTFSACATLALWQYNSRSLRKERREYKVEKTFHRKQCIYAIKRTTVVLPQC